MTGSGSSTGEWKVFWKIVFEVHDHQPSLTEEVTIWCYGGTRQMPERVFRIEIPLSPQTVGDVGYGPDRAIFRGGYVKCDSFNLDYLIRRWGGGGIVDLPDDVNLKAISVGESISIRVDMRLDIPMSVNPIFYYPLSAGKCLALHETYQADTRERKIGWKASYNQSQNVDVASHGFVLEGLGSWHRLQVRQDTDKDPRCASSNYYDLLVDSFPRLREFLGTGQIEHEFDSTGCTFYIGLSEDLTTGTNHAGLWGEIRRLEFDPNDSCGTCFGKKRSI